MRIDDQSEGVTPRERCPKCAGSVYHESRDPLEEYCLECDYYRAVAAGGDVIRE